MSNITLSKIVNNWFILFKSRKEPNPVIKGKIGRLIFETRLEINQLNWPTDKDVQAYLSNRPAVLCFQDIGIERSGLKTG